MVGRHSDYSPFSSDNESTDSATNYRRKKGRHSKKNRGSGKSGKSLRRSASYDNFDEVTSRKGRGRMKDNWVKGGSRDQGHDPDGQGSKSRSRQSKQASKGQKSGKSNRSNRTQSEGRAKPSKDDEDDEYEEFLKVKYGKNKPIRSGQAAIEDANEFEEFLKLKERIKKRGLSGLDLANNPLVGRPPKPGQRNPAVFLLKVTVGA